MPPKKRKGEKKQTHHSLTRQPLRESPGLLGGEVPNLYPDLRTEKENMCFSSSDDSPENKPPYRLSPRFPKKNNSPSNQEFTSKVANGTRQRRGKQQQRQMNTFQDNDIHPESSYNENSGEDEEIDNFTETTKPRENISDFNVQEDSIQREFPCWEIQPQVSFPEESMQESDSIFYRFFKKYAIVIVLIIIIFSVTIIIIYGFPTNSHENDQHKINASIIVNSLKSEFKDLPKFTFRIIGSALNRVLVDEPETPAIILLLATNGTKDICNDFASRLIDLLSVPACTVKIAGENYKQANADKAKMEIDQLINKTLKINQLGSVLINDLDQVPGQAALLFYKYFDHENALFKKAVFVMTANYNKPIDNFSDLKVWDKAANDHLYSVWTDTGIDQISPLLSRLTVSVAVITKETL